jgi:hypothetical protein
MEKIIVNLKTKRLVFFDMNNLPIDDGEEYVEMPYLVPKGIKLTDEENENMFKEIMEDYNKRYVDKDMGLIVATPFKLVSNDEKRNMLKRKIRDVIKDMENKRTNKNII